MNWRFFGEWLDKILKHDINKPIVFSPESFRDPNERTDKYPYKAKEIWMEIPVKTRQKIYKKHREVMIENRSFIFWMAVSFLAFFVLIYSISALYTALLPTTTISSSFLGGNPSYTITDYGIGKDTYIPIQCCNKDGCIVKYECGLKDINVLDCIPNKEYDSLWISGATADTHCIVVRKK